MSLYYEIHVTLHPDSYNLKQAKEIGVENHYSFDVGNTFTHRTTFYEDAITSVGNFCEDLAKAGFEVVNYQVAHTILDSRIEDRLSLVK
jgi:hypothetical protein